MGHPILVQCTVYQYPVLHFIPPKGTHASKEISPQQAGMLQNEGTTMHHQQPLDVENETPAVEILSQQMGGKPLSVCHVPIPVYAFP